MKAFIESIYWKHLSKAFNGRKPHVFINNPDKTLKNNSFKENYYTFLIANDSNKTFSIFENEFIKKINFFDNDKFQVDLSTDNWPFFYMPVKILPKSYIFILLIIFVCSFLFIKKTSSMNRKNFSITCFFLGAGFMLIETKGITELALIYGSTWFVISIIIGFVLISIIVFLNIPNFFNYDKSLLKKACRNFNLNCIFEFTDFAPSINAWNSLLTSPIGYPPTIPIFSDLVI